MKFDPIKELVNTVSDGNYYAIRNDFSTEAEWKANPYAHMMVPGLAMRKDILEEIGNPVIKSLADLDKVFADVKAEASGDDAAYSKSELAETLFRYAIRCSRRVCGQEWKDRLLSEAGCLT